MNWLSLLLVALIVAITYTQAIQGLLSASIMCGLALLCAALSFATYEWIAFSFLTGPLGDLSLPVAFMGAFVIPLIALRLALDVWITRANLIPVLIDRSGAALVGLTTALTLTGMLAVSIEMLPFGGSFLGHRGFDEETGSLNGLWFSPDRFVAAYAGMMSDGLLSSETGFHAVHPDFVQEIAWSQAAPKEVRHIAPPGSIQVVRVETPGYVFDKTPGTPARGRRPAVDPTYDRINPPGGKQWYLVRLKLAPEARDASEQHRFSRRQIRLVADERPGGRRANYAPVAINDNERPNHAVRIADGKLYKPNDDGEVDCVFEVPQEFAPQFIEYMIGARADLHGFQPVENFEPMDATPTDSAAATTAVSRSAARDRKRGPGGRVSGVRVTTNTRFGDMLPVPMTSYQRFGLEESRGALVSGHVYGDVDAQNASGPDLKLTRFDVPADKRLFHLEVEKLRARSGFGKALSLAVTTARNYRLTDKRGTIYQIVGQYALATVDGKKVIEVQYFPQDVAASGRGGIRPFRRIKKRNLDDRNTELVYLFLVDPGAEIVEFTTGRRPTDLSDLGLVAPR